MKRFLTITGITVILVALTTPFLVGADYTNVNTGDHKVLNPEPSGGGIMAVVKDEEAQMDNVQYGELVDGEDRYLLVINADCDTCLDTSLYDTSTTVMDTITLTVCPGPGTYHVTALIASGDDSITRDLDTLKTDSLGELSDLTIVFGRGGATLIHFDPVAPEDTFDVTLDSDSATWDVNGRKIAIDDYGKIHICYTDTYNSYNHLIYATSIDNGITWQKQKVDSSTTILGKPAIALDKFGVPFIAYAKEKSDGSNSDLFIWSEGVDESPFSWGPVQTNPAIAIDAATGHGIERHTIDIFSDGVTFETHSFPVSDNTNSCWPQEHVHVAKYSCTFSDSGNAVLVGRALDDDNQNKLYRAVKSYKSGESWKSTYYQGTYGNPSIARQDDEVWIAYSPPEDDPDKRKVYYKKSSYGNDYDFSGTELTIGTTPGIDAQKVQIAEDFPVVVWEDHRSGGGMKIFYSYMQNDGSWTTPDSVSSNPASITECFPHVAVNKATHKAHVIWTELGTDTSVGIGTITVPDSIHVFRPNGGEIYPLNAGTIKIGETAYKLSNTIPISWSQLVDTTNQRPETTFVKVTYAYDGENTNWSHIVDTLLYENVSGRTTTFTPKCSTDRARVRVEAYYGGTLAYDISDSNFTIYGNLVVWPKAEEPIGPSYTKAKSTPVSREVIPASKGILAVSNSSKEVALEDTSQAPKLLVYFPDDTAEDVGWAALSYVGLDSIMLEFSDDGGETYSFEDGSTYDTTYVVDTITSPDDDTLYNYYFEGSATWDVPEDPVYDSYLRFMGIDTLSDTVYSYPIGPFMIPPAGSNPDMTRLNQRLIGIGTSSGKIGIAYQAQETDTSAPTIRYMGSNEGLDFDTPDSLGVGIYPAMAEGAVVWVSENSDSLFGTGWTGTQFDGANAFLANKAGALYTKYSPPSIIVDEEDTARATILARAVAVKQGITKTYTILDYLKFPKDDPNSVSSSSYPIDSILGVDTTSSISISLANLEDDFYVSYNLRDTIYYIPGTISGGFVANDLDIIGPGFSPQISAYEGNVILSYMHPDSGSMIRMWGYRDDSIWVETDTIELSDTSTTMTETKGTLYSLQTEDTITRQYVYDPISEELYLERSYEGFYTHPWLDEDDSTFARIDCYTWAYDSGSYALRTNRKPMNVIDPALYIEADDLRSPFCDFRDTCIHYTTVDVDSGTDSLGYLFPYLDDSKKYAVILEFYTECDSTTELEIEVGTNLDTIQIAPNSFSWYEQDVSSGTDTLEVVIRRLSEDGFVPVSRVIVRRRSDLGIFMMGTEGPSLDPVDIPFCLYQPFPNPFSNSATIRYSLPKATHVTLKVYDVSGRLVNKLIDEEATPGVHQLVWSGEDDLRRRCASGVYFVRFTADAYQASKKMVLVK